MIYHDMEVCNLALFGKPKQIDMMHPRPILEIFAWRLNMSQFQRSLNHFGLITTGYIMNAMT